MLLWCPCNGVELPLCKSIDWPHVLMCFLMGSVSGTWLSLPCVQAALAEKAHEEPASSSALQALEPKKDK